MKLILASTSPYRRELLARLRLPFEVLTPQVDETPLVNETPARSALRLSIVKARVPNPSQAAIFIGSDQAAELDGLRLSKPGNFENAVRQLAMMRGKEVVFHTGVSVYNSATLNVQSCLVPYTVLFRDYSDAEIHSYLAKEQPYGCAGSAKVEGLGITLIKKMWGDDPTALIGLPLIALSEMLRHEGVNIL